MAESLSVDDSIEYVMDEVSYTKIGLASIGHLPAQLAIFEGLETEGQNIWNKGRALRIDVFGAQVVALHRDHELNAVCSETLTRLSAMNDAKERSMIRGKLVGNKSPSAFCRPILGRQLESMRTWPAMMSAMTFEPLKSYAPVVSDVVERSRLAESDLEAKDQAEDQFYFVGDYKKFIDQVNSARKSLESEAESFRHAHPELNLRKDFASSLFRKREREKELTLDQLDQRIASVETMLDRLKLERAARLIEIEAEEAERKAAEHKAKLAQIAEKEKEVALLAGELAALKAELAEEAPK